MILLTGVMFMIAALFKLGGLTGLVSRPVLQGFAFDLDARGVATVGDLHVALRWPGRFGDIGGFAKSEIPYAEFLWADYLRSKIAAHELKGDMKQAVKRALVLARSGDAGHLPGWCRKE